MKDTRKPFIGGGTITTDNDGGYCVIFPRGKSKPFSKEVCDYFKSLYGGRNFGKDE